MDFSLPIGTKIDELSRFINDNIGNNYVLKRGIDRFIIWYNKQQIANNAKALFQSEEIKRDGLNIVNDLPYLCNHVLSWIHPHSLPY